MSNVPHIQGPAGSPKPQRDKTSDVDPHKFQAAMHRKIDETDEKQKKKKKQQQEQTEDDTLKTAAKEESAPTVPTGEESFLTSTGGTKQSFKSEGAEKAPSTQQSLFSPQPPSVGETAPSEEEEAPVGEEAPTAPQEPSQAQPQQTSVGPPESSQESQPTQKTQHAGHKEAVQKKEPPKTEHKPLDAMAPTQLPQKEEVKIKQEELIQGVAETKKAPETAPLGELLQAPEEISEKKAKEDAALEAEGLSLPEEPAGMHAPIIMAPKAIGSEDPFSRMPPAIQEIFSKMLGVITVMNQTPGVTETTFTLNNPRFASSVFFGTQITIKEYSTAPLAFNVQMNGTSDQAVNLLQANTGDLMAAFQGGAYDFKINRVDTGYTTERPLFHRKDAAGGDAQDQPNRD